ncbi:MAG: DUF2156 domain-containing protein [Solirubrobacteraceae bacterium]|nr:DUF2156 domain-containing protein [Solirubrobacteraceae bacterium]
MASNPRPQGPAYAHPSISLPRALHDDAPFASYSALAHLPEHPSTTIATRDLWLRITEAVRHHQAPAAELSFHTMRLWYGDPDFTLSRIGAFIVVGLHDAPRHATVIAIPGARTSPPVVAHLATLFREVDVRLLSETTADALSAASSVAGAAAIADRDTADYVLSMDAVASLEGPAFHTRRREVRRFTARHGAGLEFRAGHLGESWANEHLAATTRNWIDRKFESPAAISAAVRREWRGILGWAQDPSAHELRLFAVSLEGQAVGASVVAPMWNGTWMGIVLKTDPSIPGLTAYLRQRVCQQGLRELGPGAVLNIQQDDGLAGLRAAKLSYRPVRLVPKFSIQRGGRGAQEAA